MVNRESWVNTDLVGSCVEISERVSGLPGHNSAWHKRASGRVRAVTTQQDVMCLWLECENDQDVLIWRAMTEVAIGDVMMVSMDRGSGAKRIRVLPARAAT